MRLVLAGKGLQPIPNLSYQSKCCNSLLEGSPKRLPTRLANQLWAYRTRLVANSCFTARNLRLYTRLKESRVHIKEPPIFSCLSLLN